jgi:hypothetical protein
MAADGCPTATVFASFSRPGQRRLSVCRTAPAITRTRETRATEQAQTFAGTNAWIDRAESNRECEDCGKATPFVASGCARSVPSEQRPAPFRAQVLLRFVPGLTADDPRRRPLTPERIRSGSCVSRTSSTVRLGPLIPSLALARAFCSWSAHDRREKPSGTHVQSSRRPGVPVVKSRPNRLKKRTHPSHMETRPTKARGRAPLEGASMHACRIAQA